MQLIVHYEALIVGASQPDRFGVRLGMRSRQREGPNGKRRYAWEDKQRLVLWAPRGDH